MAIMTSISAALLVSMGRALAALLGMAAPAAARAPQSILLWAVRLAATPPPPEAEINYQPLIDYGLNVLFVIVIPIVLVYIVFVRPNLERERRQRTGTGQLGDKRRAIVRSWRNPNPPY